MFKRTALTPHSVHPIPFSRRGLNLLPNFQKGGEGLDSTSIFRGGLLEKEGGGGCNFYIKSELKYEIFNGKKSL